MTWPRSKSQTDERSGRQTGMPTFSVVIPNYNYGHFIADAVTSALAVEGADVEVIVVDDGSTDDSLAVLEQFGDRITVIAQPNAGPRIACNRGFAASSGDIVIFLDSDDQLTPSIAREVAAVWRPGISKVQVQMQQVDTSGRAMGRVFPAFDVEVCPDLLRRWMTATGEYPTPPGSGNAYARAFLEVLFPLDDSCGDATDSACVAAAPYMGDVVTIAKPLVRYRIHGDNRSKLSNPVRFTRQVERAYQRHQFALRISGQPFQSSDVLRALRRGRHLLQMRVAERRLNRGAPPIPDDTTMRLVWDSLRDYRAPGPEPRLHRLLVCVWCLVTLSVPSPVARFLIARRFR